MHGAPSWVEPRGRPRPVAALYPHAGNHVRKLGSTVGIAPDSSDPREAPQCGHCGRASQPPSTSWGLARSTAPCCANDPPAQALEQGGKPGPRGKADSTGHDHRNRARGIGPVCRDRARKSLPCKPTPAARLSPGQSMTARNTDIRRPSSNGDGGRSGCYIGRLTKGCQRPAQGNRRDVARVSGSAWRARQRLSKFRGVASDRGGCETGIAILMRTESLRKRCFSRGCRLSIGDITK